MDIKELPKCLCGKNAWDAGGASLSPNLTQYNFHCGYCNRLALFLYQNGNNVLLIAADPVRTFPERTDIWLNEILLSTWRDRNERLKAAQKPLEDRWWNYACDEIGVPRGTTFEDVPKEKHAQWRAFWALLYENYRAYRVPEGFEKTLIPPQLPQGLAAYILQYDTYGKASWEEVTREVSLAQPVPADPIRVRHDKFFSEVFTEVRKNLGCDFTTEYVPNAYCGAKCEPWFRFILGANTLIVGPRKRVTTIRVTAPQGLNTRKIRAAAVKVETTYTADGGWQSDIVTAHELEVHAWDKKQLVEFLTIIGTESLAMVPA